MRRLWTFVPLFSLLLGMVLFPGRAVQAGDQESKANFADTDVEAFIDQEMKIQMERFNIPNAAVAVVADGSVVVSKGYGYADLQEQTPVDPERTLFRIGSTSKLFTWIAVMQLVEQGQLDLEADIRTYLDFQIPGQLHHASSQEQLAPITLTHLMTHTAGFEDYPDTIFRLEEQQKLPLADYLQAYMPKRAFPPGEVAAYSNYGTALAGYIVERVSGQPFADYIEQHIFSPLGMKHSSFRQPLPAQLQPDMARAYRFVQEEYKEGRFEYVPEPAGGMSSSASDMSRFMLAYLQGGRGQAGRILADETIRTMQNQQFTQHPLLSGTAFGFIEGSFNGERTLFHGGSTMLFDTGLYLIPEHEVGLFVSFSGGSYLAHTGLFQAFMDQYYPTAATHDPSLTPPEGTMERSRQYVGEYQQNRRSFTTSERFLSLTMGLIHVQLDKEGYLIVNHAGEANRFVEIEPGIYRNLREHRTQDYYGAFKTIVFGTDPMGNTMLMSDGPMTYSKAPWYGTSSFTFLTLIAALLFIIISLIFWMLRAIYRQMRRSRIQQPRWANAGVGAAIGFGVLTAASLVGVALNGQIDPVYGLPNAALGILPSWNPVLDVLPWLMIVIGAALIIFTLFALWKRYWKISGRIHYTLFTASAWIVLLLFMYWQLIS
ncbi:serine hydrolase domain-containing protein [Paenibacillus bouchesdurhonensis]|uniref:serine hydrolase domain-containing protein n=1 Tax=Paenibacillus bouchesdurhonensis TaxID=1870990 RepID=UPI000DA5F2A6|nr:serine hydrolase domain-containing protein [Paenibacillus bouchesdurhonensis]